MDFVAVVKPRVHGARWVRPEGLHITLKFLGNVKDEKRGAIEGALNTMRSPGFTLSLHNIGVFPTPKHPRVLWIGIDSGPELAPPSSHPIDQPVPGPAGRVPADWEQRLDNP